MKKKFLPKSASEAVKKKDSLKSCLERAVEKYAPEFQGKRLKHKEILAQVIIREAERGMHWANQILWDRLEGRANRESEMVSKDWPDTLVVRLSSDKEGGSKEKE